MYVPLSCVAIPRTLLRLGSLLFCQIGVLLATVLHISSDLTATREYVRSVGKFIQILQVRAQHEQIGRIRTRVVLRGLLKLRHRIGIILAAEIDQTQGAVRLTRLLGFRSGKLGVCEARRPRHCV